jgi:dihydroorotase
VANQKKAVARWGEDIPIDQHPVIRSEQACYLSSSLAVDLARQHGTQLHVLHLTTARELELFDSGPVADKRITVEACVHHLYFDAEQYATHGNLIKCNPAIKTPADRQALLAAVASERIDVIATDHAPHTWEEKQQSFNRAPAGLPLVQDALPSLFTHIKSGALSLEQVVDLVCHNPARLFKVHERGFLREGYWADLVLVDPDSPYTVKREDVLSRCGWSPFEGHEFPARVIATVVSGHLAYQDGRFDETCKGQRLQFDR